MIKSKTKKNYINDSILFILLVWSRFLKEEPERLDYTIKKCKRLTTMLYQLKRFVETTAQQQKTLTHRSFSRLAVNQDQRPVRVKSSRHLTFGSHGKPADRKRLLEQIESVTQNSEGRVKAIEVH